MRRTPSSPIVAASLVARCAEQHLVADPAHALAGRPFGGAEDGEANARLLQDANEGARDLLAARVVRHRRADVEQIVELRGFGGVVHDRDAEPCGPRGALARRQPPRVAFGLVGLEQMLQLVRELAGDHHLVLAHAEELVEVLELDRARRLAVAAGRARPERLVGDHGADQCRQLRLGVARDDQVAVRDQMMLDAVVDHLQRQGLSGQVGRTRVLAAAALGAGERVEAFLPGQVARVAHAGVHLRLVLGFHELVEVDRSARGCPGGRAGNRASATR